MATIKTFLAWLERDLGSRQSFGDVVEYVSLGLLAIAAGGIATYQAGWQASMTERVGQLEKRVTAADNLPVAVARIEVRLSAMQDSIARIDRKLGP